MVSDQVRTSLFVPTNRPGGLDVLENSLATQSVLPDYLIVCDDYEGRNKEDWYYLASYCGIKQIDLLDSPPRDEVFVRNLARAYNDAASLSMDYGCDLMISLQDYIHIPTYGIERFQYCYTQTNGEYIYTGLTSIAGIPTIEAIENQGASYSIFREPYKRFTLPTDIQWWDVRHFMYEDAFKVSDTVATDDTNHWEANWAAVPVKLFHQGIRWNEEYDKGYAYENSDFARRAIREYATNILIDKRNHAVSLPHFDYWPQDKEDLLTYSNKERYDAEI